MANAPERVLIELKRRSADADVETMARAHFPAVYATCLRITRDRHDAEDAAQAVFLCLAIQVRSGSKIRALGPWLNQVARRAAIDVCRRRKRRKHHESAFAAETSPAGIGAAQDVNWDELRPAVVAALNDLPAKYRLPLVMHYFGGMDQEQLAEELSCTRVNLRVRMHRGHKMLREVLQRRGVQLAGGMLVAALADAVQYQVSKSVLGGSVVHAGQLSMSAFGGPGMLAMAGGASAMRLKVLLVATIGIAAVSAATAPLLARLKGEWQEIPIRPSVEGVLPALPAFTAPVPKLAVPDLISKADEAAGTQVEGELPTGVASQRAPQYPGFARYEPRGEAIPAAPRTAFAQTAANGPRAYTAASASVLLNQSGASEPEVMETGRSTSAAVQVRHHPRRNERRISASAVTTIPFVVAEASVRSVWPTGSGSLTLQSSGKDWPVTWRAFATSFADSVTCAQIVFERSGNIPPVHLVNNGQVMARGFHLDYSSYYDVLNTKENTAGVNGWFAVDGGAITLPPIRLTAGDNHRNWGESDADASIDLINSLSIAANAPAATTVSITLLATDHPQVPSLPAGHHFVGIWKMVGGETLTSGLDLTVRYDDTRLTYLGLDESFVKLWYHAGGGWVRVTDESFVRDTSLNQVSGHVPAAGFYGVSTPEPTGAMFVIFAGAGALLRRRR